MNHPLNISRLKSFFKGDIKTDEATLEQYSHDASLFEIKPTAVVYPKDSEDVRHLVKFVSEHKAENPNLSLTARSAGTDMSGGAINDSILVAFEKYFNHIGEIKDVIVSVQPGVFYRDFEKETLKQNLLMPSYPASREICMLGGIIANNSGGEKSLVYGKTQRYVTEVKMVCVDGQEYIFHPVSGAELQDKLKLQTWEGELYRAVHELLIKHQDIISVSRPKVSKNSTGYNVWDAWDGTTLDLTKLIVGSQGTLGIITQANFRLVPVKPLSGMMVVFMPSLKNLAEIINALLALNPSSLESFDDHTLAFAFRFFYSFRKTLGWKHFLLLGLSFIPLLNKLLPYLPNFPKIVLLVEFEGDDQVEIDEKMNAVKIALEPFKVGLQEAKDKSHEEKFWIIRRESFNLLRKNVKNKHTAPFIDDLIVPPSTLPQFLPELLQVLEEYQLLYTIAGHMGDGNFHIIPLMDLSIESERAKIPIVLKKVTSLVLKYNGSLSGEHNDGLIRGPFLQQMYSPEMIELFKQLKTIFDPQNIFNPHKKITADWQYSQEHIRQKF